MKASVGSGTRHCTAGTPAVTPPLLTYVIRVRRPYEELAMAYRFPSKEWTDAFAAAVNENELYREHGKLWTFGAVAMVVRAAPALGIADDSGMVLDVHEGVCRGATYGHGMDFVKGTPFVIVADFPRWRDVIEGRLDPIKGMMEGKLKLTVGHLPTMIRFVESSRALVRSAAAVPTEFPA